MALSVLYARCAGLDVHKVTVVACLFFETLDTTRQRDTAVRRLQALGYKVTLEESAEVSA